MGDAKPNAQATDAQAEESDEAYCASVVEAWRRRPFFVNDARETAERLKGLGFRAYLDHGGSLLIADATGMGRDLSRFVSAADLADASDVLVAGLAEDPELLGPPYQPEPQRPNPVRVRAAAAPSQPELVTSVCAESCAYCGSNEEWAGNLLLKVAVVDIGVKTWVHAKCWARRAKQEGEPAPPETPTDDEEAP
jgi:hypothetical protein